MEERVKIDRNLGEGGGVTQVGITMTGLNQSVVWLLQMHLMDIVSQRC